ncbi:MAG: DNA-binding transcriptional regulator NtrC [Verrucomicrobiae bacterium]|nr:DNA-binding transcriptional regulator NtrC [Verrucomicrobiae bacterium]
MNPNIRVLVVDDHPQHRQAAARLLWRQGFEPLEAASGDEAMNLLATEDVTVVLSDMEMPRMNGLELLQHIHRRYPQLPVILMTPFYDEDVRDAAVLWGAAAVLEKPLSGALITSAVQAALSGVTEAEVMVA